MKRSMTRMFIVVLSLTLALGACKGRENAAGGREATETIAPATPQPEQTGTDAMTQTVDIGENPGQEGGRSVSEGGALTMGEGTSTTATTTAATSTTTTATPPPTTTTR